jgi:hypothetical protein
MPKTTIPQAKQFSQLKWDTKHPNLTEEFIVDYSWDMGAVKEAYTLENGGRLFTVDEAEYCLRFQPVRPQDFRTNVDRAIDAIESLQAALSLLTEEELKQL